MGSAGGHAVVWADGVLTLLDNSAIPSHAAGINNRGQIVGTIGTPARAVIWTVAAATPPGIDNLRLQPASGRYRLQNKACGGRHTVCLRLTVRETGAGAGPYRVALDWGDGTAWVPNTVPAGVSLLGPHDYAAVGDYTARVTVTDTRGAAATETVALSVVP